MGVGAVIIMTSGHLNADFGMIRGHTRNDIAELPQLAQRSRLDNLPKVRAATCKDLGSETIAGNWIWVFLRVGVRHSESWLCKLERHSGLHAQHVQLRQAVRQAPQGCWLASLLPGCFGVRENRSAIPRAHQ
jgi:hypothetical protein